MMAVSVSETLDTRRALCVVSFNDKWKENSQQIFLTHDVKIAKAVTITAHKAYLSPMDAYKPPTKCYCQ